MMLANVYRHRHPWLIGLPFLLPRCGLSGVQTRGYAQRKIARTPRSTTQQSTTKPSPKAQVKNRSLPPSSSALDARKKNVASVGGAASSKGVGVGLRAVSVDDEKEFAKLRQETALKELGESGDSLELARLSHAAGMDPWGTKTALLDLRIPPKMTNLQTTREIFRNDMQNVLSMIRLAGDFAFPGIVTKWWFSPQIFRAKSTSDKAWVAPFRLEMLDVYKKINRAIASGNMKTLRELTAYEYHSHAHALLQRNLQRTKRTGLTADWSLHSLLSPVKILSLRAFPLYSAPEEPRYGNRNIVQALVRFESLQTLVLRDDKGRIVKPDGKVVEREEEEAEAEAEGGWKPDPRRVLEYLILENKMFYPDGWYVRDQVFEGVKPHFKEAV